MARRSPKQTDPAARAPQLLERDVLLEEYAGRHGVFQRLTTGLKSLVCPLCQSDAQRLVRVQQYWSDSSDYLCEAITVDLIFLCKACEHGWRFRVWNDNEGTGEIMVEIHEVETLNAEHARLFGAS